MTKRRAENILHYDGPLKRCVRSLCKIDTQLTSTAVACGGSSQTPLSAFAESCRKRAHHLVEQEITRPQKRTQINSEHCAAETPLLDNTIVKNSGSFQEENKPLTSAAILPIPRGSSKRRIVEETMRNKILKSEKESPTEDELSTFNSFQFWRVPLPDVDLSELQSDDGSKQIGPPSATDYTLQSETDAMET